MSGCQPCLGEPLSAVEIADQLDRLAQQELDEVKQFLETVPLAGYIGLIIEAYRCLDHAHVIQLLSSKQEGKLSVHDFDILARGCNVLLGLLLSRKPKQLGGIPLRESTPQLRQAVVGMMHFAGRSVILSRTSQMLRHGMVSATAQGKEIELALSNRAPDYFHDQIDHDRLIRLSTKLRKGRDAVASDLDPPAEPS